MKRLGIFSFVNQTNYGGVLQCAALQHVVRAICREQGRGEVEVEHVNWWMSPQNCWLVHPCGRGGKVRRLDLRLLLDDLLHGGRMRDAAVRSVRTQTYLAENVARGETEYRSIDELSRLGERYDALVVGGDQMWNCRWLPVGCPVPGLLENVPSGLPRLAYSVSLGMADVPAEREEAYRAAWRNFIGASMREASAADVFARIDGRRPDICLDPVLLVDPSFWRTSAIPEHEPYVALYWLGDFRRIEGEAASLARRLRMRVKVWLKGEQMRTQVGNRERRAAAAEGVEFHLSDGPREFVDGIRGATLVASDSYHALCFAHVFGRSVRIVAASDGLRASMATRFSDFIGRYGLGDVLVESLAAIESVPPPPSVATDRIDADREFSRQFLARGLTRMLG